MIFTSWEMMVSYYKIIFEIFAIGIGFFILFWLIAYLKELAIEVKDMIMKEIKG